MKNITVEWLRLMTNSIDQNHKKSFVMITRQMPTKGNEESGRVVHLPNLNCSESDDKQFIFS